MKKNSESVSWQPRPPPRCNLRLPRSRAHKRTCSSRIFNGELREEEVTQPSLKAVCRACQSAQESRRTRVAFHDLLQQVSARSGLVSGQPVIGHYGWQAGNTFVDGLLALARHSRNWIRSVAAWKPQTHNTRRQFASLARHLFAEWPVPAFMDSVWFLGNSRQAVE